MYNVIIYEDITMTKRVLYMPDVVEIGKSPIGGWRIECEDGTMYLIPEDQYIKCEVVDE